MSKALFSKIITELQSIHFEGRVSFSFYNEPLLAKDLDFFIAEVKNNLPKVHLLLYTNGTLLTLERLYQLIELGVKSFVVTRHENESDYLFEQTFSKLPDEIKLKHIKYQTSSDLKLTNRGGLLPHIVKEDFESNLPCLIPNNMLTITNQGSIVPCFEDFHQVHTMGNLNEQSILDIWNSTKYKLFRKQLLLGMRDQFSVCSNCNRNEMIGIN
jgi:radical SAM protein with 4Fe4S-binding SPASM domain